MSEWDAERKTAERAFNEGYAYGVVDTDPSLDPMPAPNNPYEEGGARALDFVLDDSDVVVTVRGPLTHRCPHVDEVDDGGVEIAWRVKGETFELHSLANYLRSFKDAEMSHEQITDRIRHDLSVFVGIDLIDVKTTWATAGLEVTCSTSPTLVATP